HLVFVRVPWIGEWQVQAANLGATQDRQNIRERNVLVVRSLVVAPTDMKPHFAARDTDEGRVDGGDHSVHELLEILERPFAEGDMALEGEVGRIDLKIKAAADNGLVLDTQGGSDRVNIGVEAWIVLVLHDRGQNARRGGGKERGRRTPSRGSIGR